MQTDS